MYSEPKKDFNIFLNNKEINTKETKERKIILESKPLILGVIINDWCNLDCIMCLDSRHKNQYTLSAPALWKIKELLPYLERIDWQGGEFFHLSYVKEIFLFMKKYPHIKHTITTNGLLLNEEWIELLLHLNTAVTFSIDSPRKKTYEYIRRGGSYNELIERLNLIINLEQKYKRRLERYLTVVVMKSNYLHLAEFVEFAKKYGFSSVFFSPVRHLNNEENIFKYINKDIQKYLNEIMCDLKSRFAESGIEFKCNLPDSCKKLDVGQNELPIKNGGNLLCDLPWKGMFICGERNGDIVPDCWCLQPIGNIFQNTLLEVWNNTKMQEYRRRIAAYDMGLCSECYAQD
jgi:MoaA/NifB/PqqE/SkfB family radical SAM enzyme